MARNLDEFAADLTKVTQQVVQAATTGAQARALVNAAQNGGEAAVRKAAESMSTADLQRIQKQLSQ